MNSKSKGNIGESRILWEFVNRGIQVAIPFGDNARYDLVADFNNKLNKIQVKFCNQKVQNGSIVVPCAGSTNHTTNKIHSGYLNDIDYFAFYFPEWDKTALVPIKDVGNKHSLCFRETETKNHQKINTRFVDDYSFDKTINQLRH